MIERNRPKQDSNLKNDNLQGKSIAQKGCGKEFDFRYKGGDWIKLKCGIWKNISLVDNKMEYCSECKSQEESVTKDKDIVRIAKMMEMPKIDNKFCADMLKSFMEFRLEDGSLPFATPDYMYLEECIDYLNQDKNAPGGKDGN